MELFIKPLPSLQPLALFSDPLLWLAGSQRPRHARETGGLESLSWSTKLSEPLRIILFSSRSKTKSL